MTIDVRWLASVDSRACVLQAPTCLHHQAPAPCRILLNTQRDVVRRARDPGPAQELVILSGPTLDQQREADPEVQAWLENAAQPHTLVLGHVHVTRGALRRQAMTLLAQTLQATMQHLLHDASHSAQGDLLMARVETSLALLQP